MKIFQRFAFMQILLALFVSSAALSAFADPPSRAVRLQYISGPVSIQPGGVNDWVEAVVNRPLTTADRVWTDKAAKAELHLGSAALRLNAETSMTLTNVSDEIVQIELDQGTLNLHIRHLFGGETYEIDTPNQAFTILKSGDYRFDVDPNADTTSVTIWHGEGEANGQGPGVKVKSGQQVTFSGGNSLQHQAGSAPGPDGFDDWCRVRDDREDHAKSYQYVSADVVGADELDAYGTWRVVGAYGPVWVPAVAPGWAPYHYGHWVWVEPWGWTWVDDAPWGYAPCHYGRWVYAGGFWGWAPGPMVVARPVYAPALVAWVGGPHFGVGLSFGAGGGVGWFALGWGEPYVPSYAVSRTYFQQVNVSNTHITNITNVTNNYYVSNNNTTVVNNNNIRNIHYANQTVNGAVTAVPTSAMTSSQSVAKAGIAVPASAVKPETFATAAPVAPARTSVLGASAGVHAAVPPVQAMSRPVVSQAAPPPKPVPFEAKQEALAKNPGRPLDAQTEAQLRQNVARQTPASTNHENSAPGNHPAASTQPMQPVRGAMPNAAQPAKPGSPAASAPNPASDSRPAMNAGQTQPATPVHNVPRPPQASIRPVSANPATPPTPATPATASRPVPRPPTANTSSPNGNSNRANVMSSPKPPTPLSNADDRPSSPKPPLSGSSSGNGNRPNVMSSPKPATPPSNADSHPSNPRPPQNASTPNVEHSNPRPPAQSQPAPRQSTPRPPSQQHQNNNKQSHSESKPEHKNEGR